MFLRRCLRKKNGKPHSYWALVESYRTARGSRQRLVAYVGELKQSERSGWAQLGRRLEGKARPQPSLFDPPHHEDPADEEFVEVKRVHGPDGQEVFVLARSRDRRQKEQAMHQRFRERMEAEGAFRITKDELVIRPIWHQKPERVKAHILVCFLAYVLWKTLGQWMHRAGLGDAPRTLLLELARIKSGDVVLPVRRPACPASCERTSAAEPRPADQPSSGPADSPDRVVRLRCVTAPDEAQKVLLHRLGLALPQRLRRIDEFVQM